MARSPRALALAAALAALAAAAPVRGQTGNASDAPAPPPPTFLRNDVALSPRFLADLRADVCAVGSAIDAYRDSVSRSVSADSVRRDAERRVMELLAADSLQGASAVRAVADALAGPYGDESPVGRAARRVAEALIGLLQPRGGCVVEPAERREQGRREAERWTRALRAYSDFIEAAPPSLFSPPAPELLALHDALEDVMGRVSVIRSGS
ncbi:MAG TPA: hypothetical protein VEW03_01490 [Longimicrobiaceae bacterium]|nr:hypothetical protein [Longimicrobiaceae bacterium]